MVRIKIDPIKQETSFDCGPVCLKMVFSYFGKIVNSNEIYELAGIKKTDAFWTRDLAIASKKLGVNCILYTTCLGIDPSNFELYSKMTSETISQVEDRSKRSEERELEAIEKSLSLEELLSLLDEKKPIISLIDYNVLKPMEGKKYQGHFVVLTGYDSKEIFYNNPSTGKKERIPKELFEKARKARGTDEDLIVF